ncbi:MAG: RAMP superfamily CRISPR-associated protein [Thermanaeromonas sp.]|uniref:RAMP superfamily CRISPR-associated protein n=1 Tax=Thermanaeromonas sp. TaxID=2003697 RepID=UPI00243AEC94|nr:RAMP superfamily CRISPR-associated protein [Thermanaeromonas sp.]MCG0278595.1 RAMP superfamily CRISPR-associated protein [Thermanaeromonas sp.]
MTWDYFVHLDMSHQEEPPRLPWAFAAGFIDRNSLLFFKTEIDHKKLEETSDFQERRKKQQDLEKRKRELRDRYISKAGYRIPIRLFPYLHPDFSSLPSPRWLGLQVEFELLTPWYSRDDRPFHLLDNPVRKERVFGVPFMAASTWKGLLRWACRMKAGLREYLASGKSFEEWKDPEWILYLFGNEKGEEEDFRRGVLIFYPTWFDRISFEVINPHSRERRAGTQPIYYEVVPPGARGSLYLLYAPWPGMKHTPEHAEILLELLTSVEMLLMTYGISAKRTVGWGTAKILKWKAFRKNKQPVEQDCRDKFWQEVQRGF